MSNDPIEITTILDLDEEDNSTNIHWDILRTVAKEYGITLVERHTEQQYYVDHSSKVHSLTTMNCKFLVPMDNSLDTAIKSIFNAHPNNEFIVVSRFECTFSSAAGRCFEFQYAISNGEVHHVTPSARYTKLDKINKAKAG